MTVRSAEIGHAVIAAGSHQENLYVVPSGQTVIIKSIVTSASGTGVLRVGVRATSAEVVNWFVWFSIGTNDGRIFPCWVVMEPGHELVYGTITTTGNVRVWVSGAILDGVAP